MKLPTRNSQPGSVTQLMYDCTLDNISQICFTAQVSRKITAEKFTAQWVTESMS